MPENPSRCSALNISVQARPFGHPPAVRRFSYDEIGITAMNRCPL